MKKGEKKKRDRALKKRTERKQVKQSAGMSASANRERIVRQARDYPIIDCWVLKHWQRDGISPVVVARRQRNGNIVFSNCLVDFWCLGVKDAFCNADISPAEFREEFLPKLFPGEAMSISPALAHEMIYGSIEFAARYGFKPHRDFKLASYVLDPPEAHPRKGAVEFGRDGAPVYVAGPYDDVDAIMHKLMGATGGRTPGYLIPLGLGADDGLDDEDEFGEDEDEDDDDEFDADEDEDDIAQEGEGEMLSAKRLFSFWGGALGKTRSK
jgi:hypothetical protein